MKPLIIARMLRKAKRLLKKTVQRPMAKWTLKMNGVEVGRHVQVNGIPKIKITDGGRLVLEDGVVLNNGSDFNLIGRQQPCIFNARGGTIVIGAHTGMSASALVCWSGITIGSHVKIGGNVCFYDTDFHSLDADERARKKEDPQKVKTAPIHIGNGVFIGAHSIILKGVCIGDNAIVGAGSVVTKNIPAEQIWAGNPAKFIRNIAETRA